MSPFSCVVIGNESLLIQCAEILLRRGHRIDTVVTRNPEVGAWAESHGLRVLAPGANLAGRLGPVVFDWLFSIANLAVIPDAVLARATKGAINFHDGPLPRYAGLNAPVWAVISREQTHGITWHMIEGGIDEGDIVEQRLFDLAADETALTLNTRCYAAAIDSFAALVTSIEAGGPIRTPQDLSKRSYFARATRPRAAGRLDFRRDAADLAALVRGLDHGAYWNPLCRPKIEAGGRVLLVGQAEVSAREGGPVPGTVIEVTEERLVVATGSAPLVLGRLTDTAGRPVSPKSVATVGDLLPALELAQTEALTQTLATTVAGEPYWRERLRRLDPAELPQARLSNAGAAWVRRAVTLPKALTGDRLLAAIGAWVARTSGKTAFDLAYRDPVIDAAAEAAPGYVSGWVPVHFDSDAAGDGTTNFVEATVALGTTLAEARNKGTFALDLIARDPAVGTLTMPQVGIVLGAPEPIDGTHLTLAISDAGDVEILYEAVRLSEAAVDTLIERLGVLAAAVADRAHDTTLVSRLPAMSQAERAQVLYAWNDTGADYDRDRCVHQLFEAQVARTPDATAVVFEGEALTYRELDARANRVAHVLRAMGVGPDVLVGLFVPRSLELLVGAIAIHKAGGAYVPLDPAYPADRVALYISDSAAPVILTRSDIASALPNHAAQVLVIDRDARVAQAPATTVESGVKPEHLAYVIYTSGSTGRPKGVMVEHRNVSNFFTGMDARISPEPAGVWLAVTSLSFDISVLELFYTLARGFKIVLSSDENRALVSGGRLAITGKPIDFSLFYWGNDDGIGPKKYELLLEGAKFADQNGFCAVWTPERHFHAFGGPYPILR